MVDAPISFSCDIDNEAPFSEASPAAIIFTISAYTCARAWLIAGCRPDTVL